MFLWKAAWSFFDKGEPAAEEWVAAQARTILRGKAAQVAAGILRAVIASGDFDAYWRFHLRREHERIHHVKYSDGLVLAA